MKPDRLITVCDKCFRASCWHGEFMCHEAISAGTVRKTERWLREIRAEHPSHYSVANIERVCGSPEGR